MSRKTVYLNHIATAVPPNGYSQAEALDFMKQLPLYGEREHRFLERIYTGTRINRRHSVIADYGRDPEEFEFFSRDTSMLPEPTVSRRNDLFVDAANHLAEEAANKLLRDLPRDTHTSITHLITVTCTGFSAPGFDQHLVQALDLPPTVARYHIGFMGCYAGFPALRLAHTICTADPTARVLIVDVELCSLHFQFKPETDTMVANALFADGAAAALVSGDSPAGGELPEMYRIHGFSSRIIPDSDEAMSWRLGDVAFDMHLSTYVPRLIHRDIKDIVTTTMKPMDLTPEDVRLWAIHPGGRAILDRVLTALDLPEAALEDSYGILGDYGNMSSATIFFVLERMRLNARSGPVFAAAFGPGLTVESAHLERESP